MTTARTRLATALEVGAGLEGLRLEPEARVRSVMIHRVRTDAGARAAADPKA